MRILITGCAGFVGSEVIRQLDRADGARFVWGLDLGTPASVNWGEVDRILGPRLVHGDCTNDAIVRRLIARSKPDVVLHLAAQSHVDESLSDPTGTMLTNAVGTQVVAHACADLSVPMVYCSTDEVYGDAWESDGNIRPRVETDALLPSSPYSAGKAAGEMAVRAAARSMGLKYVITRGCNAFGPGQSGDKLVPIVCELLQSGEKIPLHGGGEQIRQWIHVSEFAGMLLSVASALVSGRVENETFNLAGPRSCSVRDLASVFARVCDRFDEFCEVVEDRPGQDRAYSIDGSRLRSVLGDEAKKDIFSLSEILFLLDSYVGKKSASPAFYGPKNTGEGHNAIV